MELALTGMHCSSCVELIQETLAEQAGVTLAVVDFDQATARVTYAPSMTTVDRLCAAVVDADYGASPVKKPGL